MAVAYLVALPVVIVFVLLRSKMKPRASSPTENVENLPQIDLQAGARKHHAPDYFMTGEE
jgi:hypothetical protein